MRWDSGRGLAAKVAIIAVAAILLGIATLYQNAPVLAQTNEIYTTTYVNLRSGPGTEYETSVILAPNTQLLVQQDLGEWLRVTSIGGRYNGYLLEANVAYGRAPTPSNTPWPTATNTPWPTRTPWPTATRVWATATPAWQPSATPAWQPTATPAWQPSPTPKWQPSPTPVWQPSPTPESYQPKSSETVISVNNNVEQYGAQRLGINIGSYDQYGAAQYLKNIIPNPGFEAAEYGMIFLTAPGASANRIQPNRWQSSVGHPAGFWDGAQFEVINGPAKGRSGTISRFNIEGGKYTFYLNNGGTVPVTDSAVIVRKEIPGFHTDQPSSYATVDTQTRPGSTGKQSLKLSPSYYEPAYLVGFDSLSRDAEKDAGKLRIVEGNWRLSLWIKAEQAGQEIDIRFNRVRETTFYVEHITLPKAGWQLIERNFYVAPGKDAYVGYNANPLAFEIRTGNGTIWIDDIELGNVDHRNPTAFSDNYVNLLKELRPGVLRNWGNQLGSTLDNQISDQFARQTTGHDPFGDAGKFHYSLHEFLELAQHIGSEPWYVIPPTFSKGEIQNLVAYLSAPAGSHPYADKRAALGQRAPWTNVFPEIHLELGNEMWGDNQHWDPFRGATLFGGENVGRFAQDRFSAMRSAPHFNDSKLNLVIGGQAGFPGRQAEIQSTSTSHDTIGVAPYFGEMDKYYSEQVRYGPLFANPTQQVGPNGKMRQSTNFVEANGRDTNLAIYEIHSHYTYGYAPLNERNDFLTGLNMGLALPLHMLTYQKELGIRDQAAFTSLQYSYRMPEIGQRARLWGLLLDAEALQVKRPTWLGVELANRAIRGDIVETVQTGRNASWTQDAINGLAERTTAPYVQSFAFRDRNTGTYSLVVFNLNIFQTEKIAIEIPGWARNNQAKITYLTSGSLHDDNENDIQVRLRSETKQFSGQYLPMDLPPHSMYVIEWQQ